MVNLRKNGDEERKDNFSQEKTSIKRLLGRRCVYLDDSSIVREECYRNRKSESWVQTPIRAKSRSHRYERNQVTRQTYPSKLEVQHTGLRCWKILWFQQQLRQNNQWHEKARLPKIKFKTLHGKRGKTQRNLESSKEQRQVRNQREKGSSRN